MSERVALITGVTGQDGSYMAELLLAKGYVVHGIKRRTSLINTQRVDHLYKDPHEEGCDFFLHYGDLSDASSTARIIKQVNPDEIYNFGAQSHVQVSFEVPQYTLMANALGTLNILESIRLLDLEGRVRFYQASSSEMFGASPPPQHEETQFRPRSPYAISKLYAYWTTVNYREAYGMHASNGILFNHEGPTRGETFVTRKITRAVAAIALGVQEKLYLGNLDARRDWGHSGDFVEGIWRIVQHPDAGDYVLATGHAHSVREFVEAAFRHVGIAIGWKGHGIDEIGVDKASGKALVEVDPRYFRPTEVDSLVGDWSKAKSVLGWEPTTDFEDLVSVMVKSDLARMKQEGRGRNEQR